MSNCAWIWLRICTEEIQSIRFSPFFLKLTAGLQESWTVCIAFSFQSSSNYSSLQIWRYWKSPTSYHRYLYELSNEFFHLFICSGKTEHDTLKASFGGHDWKTLTEPKPYHYYLNQSDARWEYPPNSDQSLFLQCWAQYRFSGYTSLFESESCLLLQLLNHLAPTQFPLKARPESTARLCSKVVSIVTHRVEELYEVWNEGLANLFFRQFEN